MKRLWILLLLILLLVACGGNTATEPAANTGDTNAENAADTTDGDAEDAEATGDEAAESPTETTEDESNTDAADEAEVAEEDVAADEEVMAEESADTEDEAATEEEGMDDATADMQMSGTDPETGLEINPDPIPRGVEFIAIGEVIQMNLTPQTSPEFVIRGPNGLSYRIATQALPDIHTIDGDTLLPHEYKINMLARATVFFEADSTLSDVLTSDNFTIIALP